MEKSGVKGLSLARRLYTSRTLGLALGLLCVAAAMYPLDPPHWVWALMLFNGLVWPHVAYQWARRRKIPYHAEQRNLLVDAFLGGFWVAAMHFNPLPSAATISMMAMNNVAIGGLRFLLAGTGAQILGLGVGLLIFAPAFVPETSQLQLYACLPLLCLYPLALGWICFRQAHTLGQHKRELLALSRTDSLTGLLNHGAWKDQLELEFQRCRRQGKGGAIALIDIDHFKAINDTDGHEAGDRVLCAAIAVWSDLVRASDVLARLGGDEFALLLRQCDTEAALHLAELLRTSLQRETGASCSVGAVTMRSRTGAADLLAAADAQLYEAKTAGRGCVRSTVIGGDGTRTPQPA
jgi:diguanylate cyclase